VTDEGDARGFKTFEESARGFKPGPTAPAERDEDRPDMSGGARRDRTAGPSREDQEDAGAKALESEGPIEGEDIEMPEGEPGVEKEMPGGGTQ